MNEETREAERETEERLMLLTIPEAHVLTDALRSEFHDEEGILLKQSEPLEEVPHHICLRLHLRFVKYERSLRRRTSPHPDIAIAETLEKKIIGITDETAKALYASVKLFWSNTEDGFRHNHKLLRFVIAGLISSDEARQHVTKLAQNDASEEDYANRIIAVLDELDRLRNVIRRQHETRKPDDNLHQPDAAQR